MKLLTKQSDYAIRALLYLARQSPASVPARQIAEAERIPLQFLRGIAQTLVRHGFAQSRQGARGGLTLARAPRTIRLADVLQLFQGPVQLTECLFRTKLCHNHATCVLRLRLAAIERKVQAEFNTITIAHLLKDLENAS